jgi:hypothetical protein
MKRLVFDGGFVRINAISYHLQFEDVGDLIVGSFSFPTKGKDFTTAVNASFPSPYYFPTANLLAWAGCIREDELSLRSGDSTKPTQCSSPPLPSPALSD